MTLLEKVNKIIRAVNTGGLNFSCEPRQDSDPLTVEGVMLDSSISGDQMYIVEVVGIGGTPFYDVHTVQRGIVTGKIIKSTRNIREAVLSACIEIYFGWLQDATNRWAKDIDAHEDRHDLPANDMKGQG